MIRLPPKSLLCPSGCVYCCLQTHSISIRNLSLTTKAHCKETAGHTQVSIAFACTGFAMRVVAGGPTEINSYRKRYAAVIMNCPDQTNCFDVPPFVCFCISKMSTNRYVPFQPQNYANKTRQCSRCIEGCRFESRKLLLIYSRLG